MVSSQRSRLPDLGGRRCPGNRSRPGFTSSFQFTLKAWINSGWNPSFLPYTAARLLRIGNAQQKGPDHHAHSSPGDVYRTVLALILAGLPRQPSQSAGSRTFSVNENQVVDAYIAYYGRPADAGGLTYWADRLRREGRLTSIIDSFGDSQEFTSRYGGLGSEQLVRNLYLQLFGRQPDGWAWITGLMSSKVAEKSLQSISLDILAGARNTDQQIIKTEIRLPVTT